MGDARCDVYASDDGCGTANEACEHCEHCEGTFEHDVDSLGWERVQHVHKGRAYLTHRPPDGGEHLAVCL